MRLILTRALERISGGLMLVLLLAPAPLAGQVAGGAEEIRTFLATHALNDWILDDAPIDEMMEAFNEAAQADPGWEITEGLPQAVGGAEWLAKTPDERRGFVEDMFTRHVDRFTTEWLPGLGFLNMMRSPAAEKVQSDGYRFRRGDWSITESDGAVFLTSEDGEKSKITFFDGAKITLVPADDVEGEVHSYVAETDFAVGERDADAGVLAGKWLLVEVEGLPLEDLSPLSFEFRTDGRFDVSGETVGGLQVIETLQRGLWELSISRVKPKHGNPTDEEQNARVLIIGDAEGDAHHMFVADELTENSLVLTWYGDDIVTLRFER